MNKVIRRPEKKESISFKTATPTEQELNTHIRFVIYANKTAQIQENTLAINSLIEKQL